MGHTPMGAGWPFFPETPEGDRQAAAAMLRLLDRANVIPAVNIEATATWRDLERAFGTAAIYDTADTLTVEDLAALDAVRHAARALSQALEAAAGLEHAAAALKAIATGRAMPLAADDLIPGAGGTAPRLREDFQLPRLQHEAAASARALILDPAPLTALQTIAAEAEWSLRSRRAGEHNKDPDLPLEVPGLSGMNALGFLMGRELPRIFRHRVGLTLTLTPKAAHQKQASPFLRFARAALAEGGRAAPSDHALVKAAKRWPGEQGLDNGE